MEQVIKTENEHALDQALRQVEREYYRAMEKFAPFNSRHEGYAVILEELDEMWDEIKTDNKERSCREAIQVAAMAIKYLVAFSIKEQNP